MGLLCYFKTGGVKERSNGGILLSFEARNAGHVQLLPEHFGFMCWVLSPYSITWYIILKLQPVSTSQLATQTVQ